MTALLSLLKCGGLLFGKLSPELERKISGCLVIRYVPIFETAVGQGYDDIGSDLAKTLVEQESSARTFTDSDLTPCFGSSG